MESAPVSGGPVRSRILHLGQAPGDKEPRFGRPFAWTAGKTLFRWFSDALGWTEADYRTRIYMAAVCRCFPGKRPTGGDRVPAPDEVLNCAPWLDAEIQLLQPTLVLPIGRLAIGQVLPDVVTRRLEDIIGQAFRTERAGCSFDVIPLPHPSGASPWPRMEPGRTLLGRAMGLIARHPAVQAAAEPTDLVPALAQAPNAPSRSNRIAGSRLMRD